MDNKNRGLLKKQAPIFMLHISLIAPIMLVVQNQARVREEAGLSLFFHQFNSIPKRIKNMRTNISVKRRLGCIGFITSLLGF